MKSRLVRLSERGSLTETTLLTTLVAIVSISAVAYTGEQTRCVLEHSGSALDTGMKIFGSFNRESCYYGGGSRSTTGDDDYTWDWSFPEPTGDRGRVNQKDYEEAKESSERN